ncbi:MAG: hypothetical protein NTV51_29585 [Verrucomicrobia bacterium]|nr:hypothetical protein [Verrucomicrobiota bacterium]
MKSPLTLRTTIAVLAALLAAHCFGQADSSTPSSGQATIRRTIEGMRQRYGPMFQQLGFTAAQGDRFIELKLQQFEVNRRVQQEARERKLAGDSAEVAQLRRTLSAEIGKELNELLGPEGKRLYQSYEVSSMYQVALLEPLNRRCLAAKVAPLTPSQGERLTEIVAASTRYDRASPSDISTRGRVDCEKALRAAVAILSREQLALLEEHARLANSR